MSTAKKNALWKKGENKVVKKGATAFDKLCHKLVDMRTVEIKESIEKILRQMCFGRDYREFSEDVIDRLFNTHVIQDKCVNDDIVIDEDIVISAMMQALFSLCNEHPIKEDN